MAKLSSEKIKSFYNSDYVNKLSIQSINKNKRLLNYIKLEKNDLVVDFGCGDGRLALLIQNQISNYIGVDFSKDFIEKACDNISYFNISNAQFICDDINSFCKRNPNSFNKAFAFDFTEHVYDEELLDILTSIKNSLKKNGKLFIHTPNADYFIEILKKIGIMKQFPEHIAVRTGVEMTNLFRKAGFNSIYITYISHYEPILRSFNFLGYLPIVGKYFKARIFMKCGAH